MCDNGLKHPLSINNIINYRLSVTSGPATFQLLPLVLKITDPLSRVDKNVRWPVSVKLDASVLIHTAPVKFLL